jgi:hypothetical protein
VNALDQREIARVTVLMQDPKVVFVFGSNRAGVHGGGAARVAWKEYGAKWGTGEGLMGRSYGIPTKDDHIESLSIDQVAGHVARFLAIAIAHPELTFAVTRVGCGLAGFTDVDIAPMFADAPANCELPEGWR